MYFSTESRKISAGPFIGNADFPAINFGGVFEDTQNSAGCVYFPIKNEGFFCFGKSQPHPEKVLNKGAWIIG
tara:strand:+ start:311 stop:526 length:216 start_codon:yes stop_codon:yes gene_type:complete